MKQTLRTVGFFYFLATVILILNYAGWLTPPDSMRKLLSEIGIALLAVGTIHLLDHVSLIREVASKIVGDFRKATADAFQAASSILKDQVKSIKVMEGLNMKEVYSSRSAAGESIRNAMARSKEVSLMGISLNEFCRQEQGPFSDAWAELIDRIEKGNQSARLLLIDPYCHGATLRAYSETASSPTVPDRLENDVMTTAKLLRSIRDRLGQNRNRLDVRVYQMAPTVFLCQLDNETFVQDYYFWNRRLAKTPFPLFHYMRRGDSYSTCIHRELKQHFDFIWEHASIRLDDLDPINDRAPSPHFLMLPSRGLEWGGHASGIQNIFIDRRRASERMIEEIFQSRRVWIQGITLKAFFDGSELANVLMNKIRENRDGTDIRILLLDPQCKQAKVRAYREFLLNRQLSDLVTFDQFEQKFYQKSKLSRDLTVTKECIEEIENTYNKRGLLKTYDAAPNMFVLIGNNSAFVEQYTYGKLAESKYSVQPQHVREVILGSDMPLIEYGHIIDPIYERALKNIQERGQVDEQLRPQPYPLLEAHFDWAWEQAYPEA